MKYLEIKETLTNEEILTKQPQEIRLAVADEADARAKLPTYEPLFNGLEYTAQLHICNHDKVPTKPCEFINLKE
jgi:hypothetical protein